MEFLFIIITAGTVAYLLAGVFHPLFLVVGVISALALYFASSENHFSKPKILPEKFSPLNMVIVVFLLIALIALGERALYDVARFFSGPNYDYFDNLQTIVVQVMLIIPLLIVSIIANVLVGENRQKYAIALIPYLITTVSLVIQISLQIMVYFYNHHTNFQLYSAMSVLVLISSVSIFLIQERMDLLEKGV